jgi:hypothetical protein
MCPISRPKIVQGGEVTAIKLGRGRGEVLVDTADLPLVADKKWHLQKQYAEHCYLDVSTGRVRGVLMHRLLLDAKPGQMVDHVNGDPLDNRRGNLRFVTAGQNARNSRAKGGKKLKVIFCRDGVWFGRIDPNRTSIFLGPVESSEMAGAAYNRAASVAYGEHARLNAGVPALDDAQWEGMRAQRVEAIAKLQAELDLLWPEASRDV